MSSFTLEIKTPDKILYMGRVKSLRARALDGELGVMSGHAPLATVLAGGKVSFRDENDEEKSIDLAAGGFLIVRQGRAAIFSGS